MSQIYSSEEETEPQLNQLHKPLLRPLKHNKKKLPHQKQKKRKKKKPMLIWVVFLIEINMSNI